jgi:hypothetical protein
VALAHQPLESSEHTQQIDAFLPACCSGPPSGGSGPAAHPIVMQHFSTCARAGKLCVCGSVAGVDELFYFYNFFCLYKLNLHQFE